MVHGYNIHDIAAEVLNLFRKYQHVGISDIFTLVNYSN